MIFCQACGNQNTADAGFCTKCGKALSPYSPPRSTVGFGVESSMGYVGYAGFWKRFVAAIIDGIITSIAGAVLGALWGGFYGSTHVGDGTFGAGVGGFLIGSVISWLYFAFMESSELQATLGKMALGIKVTDLDGRGISFGRATGRYFGKILSGLTLFVGYIMAGFTEKKQALHDIMAGCLVVNKS